MNGAGVVVEWEDQAKSKLACANRPSCSPELIPAGRCAHIGDGVWMHRCPEPECDAFTLSWGALPAYPYQTGVGHHAVAEHGAQVAGINVGILG